jgi:hypothetical protein
MPWHPDPEFSAFVFGGMIQRVREELGMIDWKQLITTAIVTGVTTIGIGYVAVRDQIAAQHAEIVEIRTLISARVAQRESQLASLADDDKQLRAYVAERVDAVRSELVTIRDAMGMCREQLAALKAEHHK